MSKKYIDNWAIFGVKRMHIAVVEVVVDGKITYNPQLSFILDDFSNERNSENLKVITLATDHFCDDPKAALYETIKNGLLISFENINSKALHFNEDLEQVAEYDFNEDFDEFESEPEVSDSLSDVVSVMMEKARTKPTIH